jgi:hypothetical protein
MARHPQGQRTGKAVIAIDQDGIKLAALCLREETIQGGATILRSRDPAIGELLRDFPLASLAIRTKQISLGIDLRRTWDINQ